MGSHSAFRRTLAAAISLALSLGPALAFAAPKEGCLRRVLKEQFEGKELEIIDLTKETQDSRIIRIKDVFGEGEPVYLGFKDKTHVYLQVGKVRYDGDLFPKVGKVRDGIRHFEPGTIIRFMDLQPETIAKLKSNLLAKKGKKIRTISCVGGACSELARAGIKLKSGEPILASKTVRRFFADEFVDSEGKPVSVEIYRTGARTVERLVRNFKDSEDENIRMWRGRAVITLTAVIVLTANGYVVYGLIEELRRKPLK